ncbi:unnamed protein product [Rangifer tarandus platyrhynchus]|uniref:Uncharacterized protein n=1 Tax=Rangifer tarandus platyrhynchus TaxID=3082113 RepID=A0AC59ZJU6_RANTA
MASERVFVPWAGKPPESMAVGRFQHSPRPGSGFDPSLAQNLLCVLQQDNSSLFSPSVKHGPSSLLP